jgi:hypothetical protein
MTLNMNMNMTLNMNMNMTLNMNMTRTNHEQTLFLTVMIMQQ